MLQGSEILIDAFRATELLSSSAHAETTYQDPLLNAYSTTSKSNFSLTCSRVCELMIMIYFFSNPCSLNAAALSLYFVNENGIRRKTSILCAT